MDGALDNNGTRYDSDVKLCYFPDNWYNLQT